MEESKNIAIAILGIVAVLAVVGLVLMFTQARPTGQAYGVVAEYYPGASAVSYTDPGNGALSSAGEQFAAYCMENPEDRTCAGVLRQMQLGQQSGQRVIGSGPYYG